jgi:DNA-binding SARP family transcriptional activator/tetratricopeptide (TPR) repeat protein
MEFRILGRLEVSEPGRAIEIAGSKQRALLAILLVNANRVVSTDRLIDGLWEDEPPETAAKALQVHVSQLRKVLGPGRLVTRSPGYLIQVGEGELDLARFEGLVESARGAAGVAASAALREALRLWRGPPLADFAYERFAQGEIARLEELRLDALESRLDAELGLGWHAALVGELEALVGEHPLRERLRGQLMLALYRSGRQAEALEAYQAARGVLVEELGIEPGRSLRELEKAILQQDLSLELVSAIEEAGEEAEASRDAFVGRETESEELLTGLEDAAAGRGRLFLLVGEPGIGKSRLADEVIRQARARGARVLVGRCWEAGGAPAYWPWLQALQSYVREREPARLRAELGSGGPLLAQLLPELREVLPDLPEVRAFDSEGGRLRLFDATASFLKSAARAQPIVLVLDDLHAADASSLLLLRFLARELAESRLLVVGALRNADPLIADPLASAVAELVREPVTRRIDLEGLGQADVARFIELAAGQEPDEVVATAIHAETSGNPFFVGEVVRLLASEGRLGTYGSGGPPAIPEGIRAVIVQRLRRLSEGCSDVLVRASVLGREFSLDALERLTALSRPQLLEALDEATSERLAGETPGAVGRLRFSHALVRDTLYETLRAAERVRLHRRAGEALEELYEHDPEPHLAELAHHYFAAASAGDADKAVRYARRAGDRAAALLAFEEAVRLYGIALNALELGGAREAAERCELLLALGDVQLRGGDLPSAQGTFVRAAESSRKLGSAEMLARAALGYGGRFVWTRAGLDPRVVSLLEEALAAMPETDSPLRARLLARLAGALRSQPTREARAALSAEAVGMARRLRDPGTLAYALDGRYTAAWGPENVEERLRLAKEIVLLAEQAGDQERLQMGHLMHLHCLRELGDVAGADAELAVATRLAEELRQPAQLWLTTAVHAMRALWNGRLEEVEELIERAFAFGRRAHSRDAAVTHLIQLFVLRREQGRVGELEAVLRSSLEEFPDFPLRCLLAVLHGEVGREVEARAVLDAIAVDEFGALAVDNYWLVSLSLLSEVAAFLGDAKHAATLYALLLPFASYAAMGGPEAWVGSVSRYLGLLATALGRWEAAEQHFENALALNAEMDARPWLAHTQHDYARMLLARDGPGDRERAQEFLDAALAAYRGLGMNTYAASASTLTLGAGPSAP